METVQLIEGRSEIINEVVKAVPWLPTAEAQKLFHSFERNARAKVLPQFVLEDRLTEGVVQRLYFKNEDAELLLLPFSWENDLVVQKNLRRLFTESPESGFIVRLLTTVDNEGEEKQLQKELGAPEGAIQAIISEAKKGLLLLTRTERKLPFYRSTRSSPPKAMVFNNFLRTAGGGERSTLHFAQALTELGFEVTLATDHRVDLSLEEVTKPFGIKAPSSWKLCEYPGLGALLHSVRSDGFEVFVNHTYGSFVRNYAPIGIFSLMFPDPTDEGGLTAMRTYDKIMCNSSFTEAYAKQYWGEDTPTVVAVPPISDVHFVAPPSFEEKEKLIITVGRFNVNNHHKRQKEAILAFRDLRERKILDESWRLVVAGYVNKSPETNKYVAECQALCQGIPAEIKTDVSIEELTALYRKASYLWQFTGFGQPFGVKPANCEHLGLVALDGFAYGTLPFVYARTGMTSIIEEGKTGYTFQSLDELAQVMNQAIHFFGTDFHRAQFQWARRSAEAHRFSSLRGAVEKVLMEHHEQYRGVGRRSA